MAPYSVLVLNTGKEETPRKRASGTGITQTYAQLRQLRGKVRFSRRAADLKADR